MSDITLQPLDVSALPVGEGDQYLTIGVLTGTQAQTPFAGPDGQPVVITIPIDVYRVPMNKQAVRDLIASLQEEVEKLPEPQRPSGLVVPGSPNEAEQIANDLRKFGG